MHKLVEKFPNFDHEFKVKETGKLKRYYDLL